MAETPEQLAQGRGDRGVRVGDRVLSGVAPAGENTVLQTDSSGNLVANDNVQLTQITDPGAASATMVTLFAVDVSGSTALYARFPSGAAQEIAIEQ